MPKKKKKLPKVEEPKKRTYKKRKPKVEPEVEPKAEPKKEASKPEAPKLPTYDNVKVVKILEDRGQFIRCQMGNGTTVDVPVHLF